MCKQNDFFFRSFFQLRIYRSTGNSFQDIFSQVMSGGYPNTFTSTRSWGNIGDEKNDGCFPLEGKYFQVYGPSVTSTNSQNIVQYAVNKLKEDFNGLISNWNNIRSFYFVFNDFYKGAPTPLINAIIDIKNDHKLEDAGLFLCKNLEQVFMTLPEDERAIIVNGWPVAIPDSIDSRPFGELLDHLSQNSSLTCSLCAGETAPDFLEKIEFNGLTPPVSDELIFYSVHTKIIDQFTENRDPGLQQAIAENLNHIYRDSKEALDDNIEGAGNLRYLWMIEKMMPPSFDGAHPHSKNALTLAARVIMSKYFTTCDVFDANR